MKHHLLHTVFLALVYTHLTNALYKDIGKPCKEILTRKEWRTLTDTEKKAYIAAVLKFQAKSDTAGTKGAAYYARVHYDWGFEGIHSASGHFLPWHRYFTRSYESELREIDSTIIQHYWDATLDYSDFWSSPVFQATPTSFGTIGTGQYNCVPNGPFKNMKPYQDRCLSRYASDNRRVVIDAPSIVHDVISNNNDFFSFSDQLESGFHARVHIATGGCMFETFKSPNEPLFFLHHANVDRLWAIWQSLNPRRYTEYGGVGNYPSLETLDSYLYGFNNYKVRDVMRISKLCYKYADTPSEGLFRRDISKSNPPNNVPTTVNRSYSAANSTVTDADEVCLGELVNIPYPIDIPDSWIKRNGGNVDTVHKYEANHRKKIDELNSMEGFVSPSSPIRRKDILVQQIERNNNARKLTCYIKGKKIVVPIGKDINETADKLIKEFDKNSKATPKPTLERLASVIGKPVFTGETLYNPFQACAKK